DGIRDDLVTGVQTCALPIFAPGALDTAHVSAALVRTPERHVRSPATARAAPAASDGSSRASLCATAAWVWHSRTHPVAALTTAGSAAVRRGPVPARNCADGVLTTWSHPGCRGGMDTL